MKERLEKLCAEEKIKLDSKIIDRIIARSEGGLRDAESLLGQIISLNLKEINETTIQAILPVSQNETVAQFCEYLIEHETAKAIQLITTMSNQGIPLEDFATQLVEMLRDLLILKATNSKDHLTTNYSEDQIKQISALKDKIENHTLINLIDKTLKRKQEIKSTPLPQLPLELLCVEFGLPETIFVPTTTPTPSPVSEKKLPHLAENKIPDTNISTSQTEPKKEEALPTPTTHTITSTIKSAISHLTGKNNSTLTVEQVKEKWKIFIDKLSEASHSLTFVVRMCTIVKIDENGLNVEVPYIFHKEKLTDFKNKKLFEQAFLDTYGESLPIVCDVVAAPNEEDVKNTNLADIAQQFGGEILAS
jgi:DNA polymerase-3 subunit gamma/tau